MHNKCDQEILSEAMHYAYLIVTGKATFEELVDSKDEIMLPYNILEEEDVNFELLIEYFEGEEEYEKCAILMKMKNNKVNK
tara:strand:- start:1423 stop:1665 length:243 start_codon:yes stop_codon:yes gene_type:complete